MSKYSPIAEHLAAQDREFIPMTFDEIETVLGQSLPASKKYPAWWSNNPTNNSMTKEWLEAGYETEQVDTVRGRLVFRKRSRNAPQGQPPSGGGGGPTRPRTGRPAIFGAMRGTIVVLPDTDLTAPTDPEWGRDPREHG